MCFMPRLPPRSRTVLSRRKLLKRAPIRNTTKSPSISAIILRPVMFVIPLPFTWYVPGAGGGSPAFAQAAYERPGRGGGIVRLGDGADHDHPDGPGGQHVVQPVQADAADREPRPARMLPRDVAWQAQAGRGAARLGRRGPQRAGAEVVHAGFSGRRVGLARAVAA